MVGVKSFFLILVVLGFQASAQEVGVINDPDGYTNLRIGPSTKSPVIAKVLSGEHFLFFPTDTSNWWLVKYATIRDNSLQGYMHNSRIKAAFPYDPADKKIYHEYWETASSFRTVKRNIDPKSLPEKYFIETIYENGQVVDLRFIVDGKIESTTLCYLSSWIKFKYPHRNTIITYNLYADGRKRSSAECEMWYKTTYTLSEDQKKFSTQILVMPWIL